MEGVVIFLLGIVSGVMLNYLADILPLYRKLTTPICLDCHQHVQWGRYLTMQVCPHCASRRKLRAFLIMIIFPCVLLWMWFAPPVKLGFWLGWMVMLYFLLIATIDLEYRAILTPTSIVGAGLGLVVGLAQRDLLETLTGGIAGGLVMLALYYFGVLFVKILARVRKQDIDEVALGMGDVTLSAILGLMVGWPQIIGALISGILVAGAVSLLILLIGLMLKKYKALMAIPYAPFLLVGAAIFLFIPK